jgi:hypothetical protein
MIQDDNSLIKFLPLFTLSLEGETPQRVRCLDLDPRTWNGTRNLHRNIFVTNTIIEKISFENGDSIRNCTEMGFLPDCKSGYDVRKKATTSPSLGPISTIETKKVLILVWQLRNNKDKTTIGDNLPYPAIVQTLRGEIAVSDCGTYE